MVKDGRKVEVIDRLEYGPWASVVYVDG
jgi:hypothetical protein